MGLPDNCAVKLQNKFAKGREKFNYRRAWSKKSGRLHWKTARKTFIPV